MRYPCDGRMNASETLSRCRKTRSPNGAFAFQACHYEANCGHTEIINYRSWVVASIFHQFFYCCGSRRQRRCKADSYRYSCYQPRHPATRPSGKGYPTSAPGSRFPRSATQRRNK